VLEIEQPDSNPLPPGGIWLEVPPDSEVLFADIHICEPSDLKCAVDGWNRLVNYRLPHNSLISLNNILAIHLIAP